MSGESGGAFETRKKEHVENVKYYANGTNIASHAWKNGHRIDFENGKIIDTGNYRTRKTLESWHTETTRGVGNNTQTLQKHHVNLTRKHCSR